MSRTESLQGDGRPTASFSQAAVRVLSGLQRACADLLDALSKPMHRAVDLEQSLHLDRKLAWQIFKIARASNPLAEGLNVPARTSIQRLAATAEASGVPKGVVTNLLDSVEAFETLIREHAGDRSVFNSMLSGLCGAGQEQVDLAHQKAAFRAQSHILGVQAKTQLVCSAFNASADEAGMMDTIGIRGLLGLRRFRAGAVYRVPALRASDDDGTIRRPGRCEPLRGAYEPVPGVSLLREFCSDPLPRFRYLHERDNWATIEVESDEVGARSVASCVLGDVWRSPYPLHADEHNREQINIVNVRTPCEALVLDLLVHEGVFGSLKPTVRVYGRHHTLGSNVLLDTDRLPMRETVSHLGKGAEALHTPLVPRYAEMVSGAMRSVEWDESRFGVYRCLVRYPVMPSAVVVAFDLPERA